MNLLPAISDAPAKITLRPYQEDAINAVYAADIDHPSSLVVAPTGTGKTVCFVELARRDIERGRRVLIIVDRDELVRQTADAIYRLTGIDPDIEQAGRYASEHYADLRKPIVIATIQTISRKQENMGRRRFERFDPRAFGRIIVDEAHLSITNSYRKTIHYFRRHNPAMRVTGFTATPMRADGQSLGQVYEHVAYRMDIREAIDQGWLVPVVGHQVIVRSLDLSQLPSKGKRDWTADEIGSLMEDNETLVATVGVLAERARGKPTLVFCARVAHAELLAAMLNSHIGGSCARSISAETPEQDRRQIIEAFRAGEINYLTNCAVLTTGFDAPAVKCVAMCRPTKSKALYTQCIGRGTRPLPGVVDGLETDAERRDAIAASDKPEVEILSFVGRAGGVDLCGPEDVLAGSMEAPEVVQRAKEKADQGDDRPITERLDEAREEIRLESESRARLLVQAEYQTRRDDLFGRGPAHGAPMSASGMATPGQMKVLINAGVEKKLLEDLRYDKALAGKVASEIMRRRVQGLATYKQCRVLKRAGYAKHEYAHFTFDQASAVIDRVSQNNWRRVPL